MASNGIDPAAFEQAIRDHGVERAMKDHGIAEAVEVHRLDRAKVKAAVVAWAEWRETLRHAGQTTGEQLRGRRDDLTAADAWADSTSAFKEARKKAEAAGLALPGLWPDNR